MTKRLFVAINLPDNFLDVFCGFQRQYEDGGGIRWTPKENLHITICFIGNVEESEISEVSDRLKEIAGNTGLFEMTFKEIIFAPPLREPRMVWAALDSSPEFRKLMVDIQDGLRKFLRKENTNKEAIAHVTLARFQDGREITRRLRLKQPPELIGRKFLVSEILLMESELEREGAKYAILEKFAFSQD